MNKIPQRDNCATKVQQKVISGTMLVTFAGTHILNRINRNGCRSAPCGTPITSRSHATVSPAGIKPECTTVAALFYCAVCIAGDGHVALISAAQSEAVCSAFCNVTLGLAIHAMFNVADGTLSALLYAFRNVFPF
ncbi:hypothetical protein B5X24_HaOG208645 [Helicoverpa armigera]|nr:hypothetical protein B5X24_HaOG208645 [Helicoverpa armigera]